MKVVSIKDKRVVLYTQIKIYVNIIQIILNVFLQSLTMAEGISCYECDSSNVSFF